MCSGKSDRLGLSQWSSDSQTWLHFRVTWGVFKTPYAQAAEIKSESLELNFKTLQVITVWFENVESEQPLRGRREMMVGWRGDLGKDQLMQR